MGGDGEDTESPRHGELEPLTAGSTRPVAETRMHAGIVRVERYGFDMPCQKSAVDNSSK
jgi:hypothetical protein